MLSLADQMVLADVAKRWKLNKRGVPLRAEPFIEALTTQCHENAARYVDQNSGAIVQGWLVEHPENWPTVIVYSHSVVRLASDELVDPTLPAEKLRSLAFIEHDATLAVFDDIKVRLAQQTVAIG